MAGLTEFVRTPISEEIEKILGKEEYIEVYKPLFKEIMQENYWNAEMFIQYFGLTKAEVTNLVNTILENKKVKNNYLFSAQRRTIDKNFRVSAKIQNAIIDFEIDLEEKYVKGDEEMTNQISNEEEKVEPVTAVFHNPHNVNKGKKKINSPYHNTPLDYSRLYPSRIRKEVGLYNTTMKGVIRIYTPLINILKQYISMNNICEVLNLNTSQVLVEPEVKKEKLSVIYYRENWKYSETQWALPAELADIVDGFESALTQRVNDGTDEYNKEEVKEVKMEEEPIMEPEKNTTPAEYLEDVNNTPIEATEDIRMVPSFKKADIPNGGMKKKEKTKINNFKLIIPEGYLEEHEYDILEEIFKRIDDETTTPGDYIYIGRMIESIGCKDKLLSCIRPIERWLGIEGLISSGLED